MFEKFGDYMFSLLFGPLRKARAASNQLHKFFSVIGELFDDNKADFDKVRDETYIISCSEIILNEFGKERKMPRLDGETTDNYRARLMLKNEIAKAAGTNKGIQDALIAAGYPNVYLEPYYLLDEDRWAEFIVYLGENTAGVITDVSKIDEYVSALKPASAKANYFTDNSRSVVIKSEHTHIGLVYPMCGLQVCGAPVNLY